MNTQRKQRQNRRRNVDDATTREVVIYRWSAETAKGRASGVDLSRSEQSSHTTRRWRLPGFKQIWRCSTGGCGQLTATDKGEDHQTHEAQWIARKKCRTGLEKCDTPVTKVRVALSWAKVVGYGGNYVCRLNSQYQSVQMSWQISGNVILVSGATSKVSVKIDIKSKIHSKNKVVARNRTWRSFIVENGLQSSSNQRKSISESFQTKKLSSRIQKSRKIDLGELQFSYCGTFRALLET